MTVNALEIDGAMAEKSGAAVAVTAGSEGDCDCCGGGCPSDCDETGLVYTGANFAGASCIPYNNTITLNQIAPGFCQWTGTLPGGLTISIACFDGIWEMVAAPRWTARRTVANGLTGVYTVDPGGDCMGDITIG